MTLLSVSTDLVMVFLSIELLSLALYVMAGFERGRLEAQEASMKYFLLGAFASAFLLYGIAFIFGGSGTTNLLRLRPSASLGGLDDFQLVGVAVALLVVGLGFKAAMVPFHMWTPDAYQGAPTPVTAFMAGGTKAAAFAAIVRVARRRRSATCAGTGSRRSSLLAVLTLVVASVVAVAQTDLKRMLAYSSISHAGLHRDRGRRREPERRRRDAAVPLRLHGDDDRRLREHHAVPRGPGGARPPREVLGPRRQAAGRRGALRVLPLLARRDPADRRVLGEVVRLLRGGPRRDYTWLAVVAVVGERRSRPSSTSAWPS